eukprot:11576014-Heterocapsa_arctica.AAC.1
MRVPPNGISQIPGYMTHSTWFGVFKVFESREHLCTAPCVEESAVGKGPCTGCHKASWHFCEMEICFPEEFREVVRIEPFRGTLLGSVWVPWSRLVLNVSIVEK